MTKCGNCQRAEGTEWIAAYRAPSGRECGNYLVCLTCLPIELEHSDPLYGVSLFDRQVADGVCRNCEGSGKYFYSGGAIGVCYQCGGNGRSKK